MWLVDALVLAIACGLVIVLPLVRLTDAAAAGPRPSPDALEARDRALRSADIKAAPIAAVVRPFEDPVPPELPEFDLVTLMFNYHDLGHLGVDRTTMNRAVLRALKPGGHLFLVDYRREAGKSPAWLLEHVRAGELDVAGEIEGAGFTLVFRDESLRDSYVLDFRRDAAP